MTLTAPAPTSATAARPLVVTRLTAAIGAVVEGLDLGALTYGDDLACLRQLLDRHQVVFLRDQHLDAPALAGLAERFGRPTVHPVDRLLGGARSVSTIVDSAEQPPAGFDWHTDLSWTPAPPRFGFLSAVEIPAYGGDTLWASGAAMWDRLTAERRRELQAANVVHRPDPTLLASVRRHHGDEVVARLEAAYPPVAHPLVRAHPGTGRPVLWLSPLYASGYLGAGPGVPLEELHELVDDPEVQVRWRWREGDVAIWDEAATCHRALTDHHPQRRVMRRATVDGSRPVRAA